MREIRMLRVMWRELETGSRTSLAGHEGGNPGYRQGMFYRVTAPALDPTTYLLNAIDCKILYIKIITYANLTTCGRTMVGGNFSGSSCRVHS